MAHSRIYLVGFMGSGKTTVGKELAALMNRQFLDLDQKIEEFTGKSISAIFSEDGEDHFRKTEADILKALSNEEDLIIATGGGTPCFKNNMSKMLKSGLTIYLQMTPEQLYERLSVSSDIRPLLINLSHNQLLAFIKDKLTFREKWYHKAHIRVNGYNLDILKLKSMINEFNVV